MKDNNTKHRFTSSPALLPKQCFSPWLLPQVAGINFTCYNAGHVLGAAMFLLEIAVSPHLTTTIDLSMLFDTAAFVF